MYHTIVAHKLRAVFAEINKGNTAPMIASLAPQFVYCFEGDLSISGLRNKHSTMQAWWARIHRILPGMQFTVRDVVAAGWPWNTRIHTHLEVTLPLQDGSVYRNVVLQVMRMKWGKLVEVLSVEDTARAARLLEALAAKGNAEATASAITDAPWPLTGPYMKSNNS
jgi:ketosteroid isomerase-like protein